MIYFLHGEDKEKARVKAREIVESLQKKKPDAAFFRIDGENWNEASFEEYIGGQGLFSNKYIVFLDFVFENKESKEIILKKTKEIGESENIFIFLEGKTDKTTLTKLEKHSEKIQSFDLKTSTPEIRGKEFNIFSLGDALGTRDKKKLWVLFIKAKSAGLEDEQIHGTLFWAVKNMILSQEAKSAKEAGLNPYVFSKSKGFSNNFKKEELFSLGSTLVRLYHDSRRGVHDLDVALEKFVLSI